MASKVTAVGLDIGSQKTMIVADDGEIVRTDTGKREVNFIESINYHLLCFKH